jgi:penicillin-binding protein 1A
LLPTGLFSLILRIFLSFFGSIFSSLSAAVLIGFLMLGAIFWIYSEDLPNFEQLAAYSPPTISRIYSGEGKLIDEFARERRLFSPSNEIPELVKQAFISAEDKNFYKHRGYDPLGILKAIFDAARGGRLRGASTITQQVMKNFLLSNTRSAERKIKELILASRIEKTLSKDKILELYLNEIFLGQNSYGVSAASQTYFNKTLEELSLAEAAYLAILPKAPSNYHPVRQKKSAIERRNFVLKEMFENGYLDKAKFLDAQDEELITVQAKQLKSFKFSLPARTYFTDEVRRQLSKDFGEDEFFTGGLTIRTTIDKVLQDKAASTLQNALVKYDVAKGVFHRVEKKIDPNLINSSNWAKLLKRTTFPRDVDGWDVAVVLSLNGRDADIGIEGHEELGVLHGFDVKWARPRKTNGKVGKPAVSVSDLLNVGDVIHVEKLWDGWFLRQIPEVQGAFLAMDVNSGRVLAMQGGFSYQSSVFNRVTQAKRQPGSGFKPFVYAAALDSGYSPNTVIVDAPIDVDTPQGVWQPKNFSGKYYGNVPLRIGIEKSRNLMTIRLAKEIGMETVASYAENFGVYKKMWPFIANSLGAQETTLFRMVSAYAMFANGGERVEPTLVDRVQDRWGKTLYRHDKRKCNDCNNNNLETGFSPVIFSERERVIDAITAYQLTSMMKGVVDRGSASSTVNLNVPVAGKTGTTNEAKDVWFIGFTSNIVAGCYIGFDIPRSLGSKATGGGMCGPIFNNFMKDVVKKYGGTEFKVPRGGYFRNIDRLTGMVLPYDAKGYDVVSEYFRDTDEVIDGVERILDGGFAMGSNLNLILRGDENTDLEPSEEVITSNGEIIVVPKKASSGTLNAGGLY